MYIDEKGQYSFVEPNLSYSKDTRLWREFLEFHNRHPEVYDVFEEEVLKASNSGRQKYSIYIIREEVRWKLRKKFKFNNNFAPYYARVFVEKHPKLKELFNFRPIKKF
ncbi:MAG TPA: hypothetical protein VKZ95_04410 [Sphingobacteriaceae bacterium]|nr:hypothetical protein [Sphingobacteriaceae bacterium]